MSGEGAIKRKITIFFTNDKNSQYSSDEYTWCIGHHSIEINNRYTGELIDLFPYNVIRNIHQESIK